MHKFDSQTGQMVGFREKIFSYDGSGNFNQNIICSTFSDQRSKYISSRCANSNLDLSEVVDIDLLDEDQFKYRLGTAKKNQGKKSLIKWKSYFYTSKMPDQKKSLIFFKRFGKVVSITDDIMVLSHLYFGVN
jgi:hypothetical protein